MILKVTSTDMQEDSWKDFALMKCNWQEKVMTTNLSPNVLIDNPQTFMDAIVAQYGTPIWTAVSDFNAQVGQQAFNTAVATAQTALDEAKAQADALAKQIITVEIA